MFDLGDQQGLETVSLSLTGYVFDNKSLAPVFKFPVAEWCELHIWRKIVNAKYNVSYTNCRILQWLSTFRIV